MLLQFSVENYKSFRGKAVLSLEADASTEHSGNYTETGKDRCLKFLSIFGANAAGKSNIFAALTAAIMTVRMSNTMQVGMPLTFMVPFKFGRDSAGAPSGFEFVFIANKVKYVYGFSATQAKIIKEYLYVYKTAKATVIFERDATADVEYTFTVPALRRQLTPITGRNTENKLFLATATAWNCEETRTPLMWFLSGINTYSTDYLPLLTQVGPMFENDADFSLRKFTTRILHEADINIDDYEFESREVVDSRGLQGMIPLLQNILPNNQKVTQKAYTVSTLHNVASGGGKPETYRLNMLEESRGTQNLFLLSPILKRAFETGETLCVDEFDTSLHPLLLLYLIRLFYNPEVNKANAQLIISSHSMTLLSLKELRRDQIYFVEKDGRTGESVLYSLDEYSPRLNEDIRKAYLLGRYGSTPNMGDGDTLWQ